MLRTIVEKARSYRRFDATKSVDIETLVDLIDMARLTPPARNGLTLKNMPINSETACSKVFPTLAWAGYLKDWPGPDEGERPTAYIVVLHDKTLGALSQVDAGIASQTINLAAVERGLGCCIIAAVNRSELAQCIGIDTERFDIVHVIAIGHPTEKVVIEQMRANDIKYWHDEKQVHHVPKRSLNDIILRCD